VAAIRKGSGGIVLHEGDGKNGPKSGRKAGWAGATAGSDQKIIKRKLKRMAGLQGFNRPK
jgi:hypothetical protein